MVSNITVQQQFINQRLQYGQDEQKMHAGNVARSSIAGEKPKEIDSFKFVLEDQAGSPSTLLTTDNNHLRSSSNSTVSQHKIKTVKGEDGTLSGNTIQPEQELMDFNESITESYAYQQALKNITSRLNAAYSFTG